MTSTTDADFESRILDEVVAWPASARLALVSKIVESLQADQRKEMAGSNQIRPDAASSIEHLIGLWADVNPKPSDEDIERIIEEERLRKYGV